MELLGIKYVHYLTLEVIIFKVRVKVAELSSSFHILQSQGFSMSRQLASAES